VEALQEAISWALSGDQRQRQHIRAQTGPTTRATRPANMS